MAGGNGRWCCCAGCWVFLDDFDRAASTDVTSNWHEEAGDWETIGNEIAGWLHELAGTTPGTDGTANSKIYGTRPVPADSAGEMQVNVSIVDPVVDDVFYIYLACDDEHGAGGDWVEFKYTGTNQWLVTLSTGESKTQSWPPVEPLDTTTPVVACIDSNGFLYGSVASSGDEFPWNDGDATGTGRYYGLGHDNIDTGAVFDDFKVQELRNGDEICTSCMCGCCGTALPKELTLTFTNVSGRVCTLEGTVVTLTWTWSAGAYSWYFSGVINTGDGDNTVVFRLTCNALPDSGCTGQNFSLQMTSQCDPDCLPTLGCANIPIAGSSDCAADAFLLKFGPFSYSTVASPCTLCGGSEMPPGNIVEYYLEVTF